MYCNEQNGDSLCNRVAHGSHACSVMASLPSVCAVILEPDGTIAMTGSQV